MLTDPTRRNHLRVAMSVAATCLIVAIFDAPRPVSGFLDKSVWPVAYTLSSLLGFVVAIWPNRSTLRMWAASLIGLQTMRAVIGFINPAVPTARWASATINIFFAMLVYLVWDGWRHQYPHSSDPKDEIVTLPRHVVETLVTGEGGTTQEQITATQDQIDQLRLPRVPGLS